MKYTILTISLFTALTLLLALTLFVFLLGSISAQKMERKRKKLNFARRYVGKTGTRRLEPVLTYFTG
jgi:hypothetical protein